MRRLASLVVGVALLAMPLAMLARLDVCAAQSCCRRMCCPVHPSAAAMHCHREARLPGGFCQLSDSCHSKTHWELTTLVFPMPPAAAQRLARPQPAPNRLLRPAAQSLSGHIPEPFEPPRS